MRPTRAFLTMVVGLPILAGLIMFEEGVRAVTRRVKRWSGVCDEEVE